jgi:hypothetical protein
MKTKQLSKVRREAEVKRRRARRHGSVDCAMETMPTMQMEKSKAIILALILTALPAFALQSPKEASLQLNAWMTRTTLAWDAPNDSSVVAYRLYYRQSGQTTPRYADTTATVLTLNGLKAGATFVFYAVSRNVSNVESGPSNTISYKIPRR